MIQALIIFILALAGLLAAARFFTIAAEQTGNWLKLPAFVVGVFIVGIGTSLPELIAGTLSVQKGSSEILPGNIIGANISNILLITGLAVTLHRSSIQLNSNYLYIDLHYLLGSFFYFCTIAHDGEFHFTEAAVGLVIFIIYSIYLIRGESNQPTPGAMQAQQQSFPYKALGILILSGAGIYWGAEFTISSLETIASGFAIPKSVIALTLLSLGTTLPELAVNITAIRQGKAEMAIGNILGSSIFNTLAIPAIASLFGKIEVPDNLLKFSLPVMAACGLLFYLLTQDKRISVWEGLMFICLYLLFLLQTAGL